MNTSAGISASIRRIINITAVLVSSLPVWVGRDIGSREMFGCWGDRQNERVQGFNECLGDLDMAKKCKRFRWN